MAAVLDSGSLGTEPEIRVGALTCNGEYDQHFCIDGWAIFFLSLLSKLFKFGPLSFSHQLSLSHCVDRVSIIIVIYCLWGTPGHHPKLKLLKLEYNDN